MEHRMGVQFLLHCSYYIYAHKLDNIISFTIQKTNYTQNMCHWAHCFCAGQRYNRIRNNVLNVMAFSTFHREMVLSCNTIFMVSYCQISHLSFANIRFSSGILLKEEDSIDFGTFASVVRFQYTFDIYLYINEISFRLMFCNRRVFLNTKTVQKLHFDQQHILWNSHREREIVQYF